MSKNVAVLLLIATGLCVSCSEQDTPFPFLPNLPTDFNLSSQFRINEEPEELNGKVAMFTHLIYQEYYDGLVSEHIVCFDSLGHCQELYYRDRETNRRYTFVYDSLGRRVQELCHLDSASTPYSDISNPYTLTTYRYSRNGRTCKARINAIDCKSYTYRLKYDRKGRLHRFIYPDGSRFTYDYDTAGRLVKTTFPDASVQTFEYGSDGQVSHILDRQGTHHWYMPDNSKKSYDSLGRVVEEVTYTDGNPVVTSYLYDDHGNWTRRTTTGLSVPTRIDDRTFNYYENE